MHHAGWTGHRALLLVLAVASGLQFGCSAAETRTRSADDAGPGWPGASPDGATQDGDAETGPRYGSEDDPAAGLSACADFVDGEGDGAVDCADAECAAAPICCVGSSNAACCVAGPAPSGFDLSSCASGATLSACSGATPFGSPYLRLGGMVGSDSDRYDAGLVLGGSVDPRVARVTVSARIRAAGMRCSDCLDHVGVGLVAEGLTLDATTRITPSVAIVVNGAQRDVRLLLGNTALRRWSFETLIGQGIDPTEARYSLELTPDGAVAVRVGETVLDDTVRWTPTGPSRIVAYGRTANPGPSAFEPVALVSLDVSTAVCDMPAALARGTSAVLPASVDRFWNNYDSPGQPSVVVWRDGAEDHAEMAFAFEGQIHRAQGTANGDFRAVADPHDPANALLRPEPSEAWRAVALRDPELVRGDDRWMLYFTAVGSNGRTTIGRAVGEPGFTWQFRSENVVDLTPGDARTQFDAPSVLVATIGGVRRELLAARRRTFEEGPRPRSDIVLLSMSSDGAALAADVVVDPALYGEDASHDFVHREGTDPNGFDADEVAAPSLVAYRNVLRLYFAGRRGTRWSIGMLTSADAMHWRLGNDGHPLLVGSGAGFDALSVSDPEPVLVGDELRLYFTGSDGVRTAVGVATHLTPEEAP